MLFLFIIDITCNWVNILAFFLTANVLVYFLLIIYSNVIYHTGVPYSKTTYSSTDYYITNFDCNGHEDDITECSYNWKTGEHCSGSSPLEIECSKYKD